jgi:hypothetical protein
MSITLVLCASLLLVIMYNNTHLHVHSVGTIREMIQLSFASCNYVARTMRLIERFMHGRHSAGSM